MQFDLRAWTLPRRGFVTDDALGEHLVEAVEAALGRGGAPAAAVAVHGDAIEVFALAPVVQARVAVPMFLAGLTRARLDPLLPTDVVGLVGTFRLRRSPDDPGVPVVTVFLEWTDCRWWHWQALLDGDRPVVREGSERVQRAADGAAKPLRLGGWWSLGRRSQVDVRLDRKTPDIVH